MKLNVEIRDLRQSEIPEVMRISDEQLGDDYFEDRLRPEDLEDPRQIYRVAEMRSDHICGFCFSRLIGGEQKNGYIEDMHLPSEMKEETDVAILQTAAVEGKYQNRGVGVELAADTMEQIQNWDTNLVLSEGWRDKRKEQANISPIMHFLDFDVVAEIENRWEEDSYNKEFSCPSCGEPPCTCDAVMFAKEI